MVYVELEDGAKLDDVTKAIKADPYFAHDETHVFAVASVDAYAIWDTVYILFVKV